MRGISACSVRIEALCARLPCSGGVSVPPGPVCVLMLLHRAWHDPTLHHVSGSLRSGSTSGGMRFNAVASVMACASPGPPAPASSRADCPSSATCARHGRRQGWGACWPGMHTSAALCQHMWHYKPVTSVPPGAFLRSLVMLLLRTEGQRRHGVCRIPRSSWPCSLATATQTTSCVGSPLECGAWPPRAHQAPLGRGCGAPGRARRIGAQLGGGLRRAPRVQEQRAQVAALGVARQQRQALRCRQRAAQVACGQETQ